MGLFLIVVGLIGGLAEIFEPFEMEK